jgi:hypothetical protein
MTYGLTRRASIEQRPAAQAEQALLAHRLGQSWGGLDEGRRLALVETALRPANDLIDGFPLAL